MVAPEQHLYQTIVQFDKTIVLLRKLATGSIHDYLFCYCPLVDILFEVLRIDAHFVEVMQYKPNLFETKGHWYWLLNFKKLKYVFPI